MRRVLEICLILSLPLFIYAGKRQSVKPVKYHLVSQNEAITKLPKSLREISGLAMSADERLFGHNDEHGVIYQLDVDNGKILKKFYVGKLTLNADFEGLAIVGDTFYLVSSSGHIFYFKEGEPNSRVPYRVYKTGLRKRNDVEGLCYDPENNCLLLACKGDPGSAYRNYRAIYAFSLDKKRLLTPPRFLISRSVMKKKYGIKHFEPSGIEYHPLKKTFFVETATGHAIVELTVQGEILAMMKLDQDIHPQPEGITFNSAGQLIIADEGKKRGSLRIYDLKKNPGK